MSHFKNNCQLVKSFGDYEDCIEYIKSIDDTYVLLVKYNIIEGEHDGYCSGAGECEETNKGIGYGIVDFRHVFIDCPNMYFNMKYEFDIKGVISEDSCGYGCGCGTTYRYFKGTIIDKSLTKFGSFYNNIIEEEEEKEREKKRKKDNERKENEERILKKKMEKKLKEADELRKDQIWKEKKFRFYTPSNTYN